MFSDLLAGSLGHGAWGIEKKGKRKELHGANWAIA